MNREEHTQIAAVCAVLLLLLIIAYSPGLLASDLSGMSVTSGNEVDLLITDSQARRTGFDYTKNQAVQEIPRSTYFRDALNDDVTGKAAVEVSHIVQMQQPTADTYLLDL